MKYYLFIEDLLGRRYGILPDGAIDNGIHESCICDMPMDALAREPDFRRRYPNTKGIMPYIGTCFYVMDGIYTDVR